MLAPFKYAETIGKQKGEIEGITKGELKRSREIAIDMLREGMEILQIMKFTKLSEDEILKLKEKL